jgi:hypothetical protein
VTWLAVALVAAWLWFLGYRLRQLDEQIETLKRCLADLLREETPKP